MNDRYEKPSLTKRQEWTFSKVERKAFMDKLRDIGIPILRWKSKDPELYKDIMEYSKEYLMDWLVTTIINQQKEIEDLKKRVG